MSERENLTKVKVKTSQEKYLNFAIQEFNLAIQEFCDDIELDTNYVNTLLSHVNDISQYPPIKSYLNQCFYVFQLLNMMAI